MRVRLIRPAYWTDADLHTRLTAEVREFYIGLWMESDDAGYIAWDVDRIGADLYPYRSLAWRRVHLPKYVAALNSHVVILACGQHIVVPALTRYQAPPKPSFQNQRAHEKCVRHVAPPGASGGQRVPAQEGGSIGVLIEGGARGANGLTQEEETTVLGRKLVASS